jgi:cell wall-associated NlpC family hydrolase
MPSVIIGHVGKRGIITVALAAVACAGCGQQAAGTSPEPPTPTATVQRSQSDGPSYRVRPQAVEPVAGAGVTPAASSAGASAGSAGVAGVSVGPPSTTRSLPQPQSEVDIRKQLAQSGMTANTTQATLTPGGLAVAPIGAPAAVQEVIAAGNEIARLPYIYGGGHMTYEDTGYDCSGSISYVFAAANLLDHTVVSGQLENWGDPGPGKWITVFANAGHTFMYVAGLRFDTVALAETGSRWSDRSADEPDIRTFSVRHPPGL